MALSRSPPIVMLWLCLQSSIYLQGSDCHENPSLWGMKAVFQAKKCMWQLAPEVEVPALEELSVCVQLCLTLRTKWTAFAYKAPGISFVELGLEGDSGHITALLFGYKWPLDVMLSSHHWHSVCLTWSARSQKLRVYVNGTSHLDLGLNPSVSRRLAPNGTLTLGVPHSVDERGAVRREDGRSLMGDIGLFRMWATAWRAEDLAHLGCEEGDVVRWDTRHWSYHYPSSCPPKADQTLRCDWSSYKIQMWAFVTHPNITDSRLESITRNWMENIFSPNISVQDISVSSPRWPCLTGNNPPLYKPTQESKGHGKLTFEDCFCSTVHVDVSPEKSVERVQAYITERLTATTFSYDSLTLMTDTDSLSIQPVGTLHSFFRVNLTLALHGNSINPTDAIKSWLNECLAWNRLDMLNLMIVAHHSRNMEQHRGLPGSHWLNKEYDCSFHARGYQSRNITELEILLVHSLNQEFRNDTLSINTSQLVVRHIVPERCPEEALKTIYGEYLWPKTLPQSEQVMICEEPAFRRAYRFCKLDFNDTAIWAQPNMTACKPLMIITDLDNVTVTADNAAEVVQMIKDLINLELGTANGGDGDLSASDMVTVVEKLENVVDVAIVTPILCNEIVSMISDMLISKSDMNSVANMLQNLTEKVGDNLVLSGDSFHVATPALALSMNNVQSENFTGMTFSVSSYSSGTAPEIVVNRSFVDAVPGTVATIALPPELRNLLVANKTRIQFQFYGIQDLFNDTDIMDGAEGNWTLNSYVISASINNGMVRNLKPQRVAVTLGNDIAKQEDDKLMCVFWDFSENDGQGGWNSQGCETQVISAHQTSCLCDHLTSFAVLLNISRAPVSEKDSEILTVISYLGCGISSSFLGITLITYMAFGKLRRDYPSKILINLSVALLALNLLYLLNTWLSSFGSYGLCIATAALLHYSLLASFTWMGLEALNMYFALVRVFNVYVPSYILKFCAVGWGVPLVIVGLVLATDVDAYGNSMSVGEDTSEPFCWIQSDVHFYVTVAAFIMLILLGNVGVFVVVLIQIRRMQANKPGLGKPGSGSSMQDLRAAASLTFLLGLTWLIAFLSFGPGRVAMLYLFCIFNSLQGFFIFLFHCLLKENVRKQWIMHLTVKRKDSSEWSLSFTASGQPKQRQEGHSHSMRSVDTSTMLKVSDSSSSTESGPIHHQRE